jgi:ribulose-5-phosphate 4-epimerase/fuculose-1-phosphate aldolase
VIEAFAAHHETVAKCGFGVLYPGHGVLVAAPTLDDAYDLLERMEFNAAAVLFGRLLDEAPAVQPGSGGGS